MFSEKAQGSLVVNFHRFFRFQLIPDTDNFCEGCVSRDELKVGLTLMAGTEDGDKKAFDHVRPEVIHLEDIVLPLECFVVDHQKRLLQTLIEVIVQR